MTIVVQWRLDGKREARITRRIVPAFLVDPANFAPTTLLLERDRRSR